MFWEIEMWGDFRKNPRTKVNFAWRSGWMSNDALDRSGLQPNESITKSVSWIWGALVPHTQKQQKNLDFYQFSTLNATQHICLTFHDFYIEASYEL